MLHSIYQRQQANGGYNSFFRFLHPSIFNDFPLLEGVRRSTRAKKVRQLLELCYATLLQLFKVSFFSRLKVAVETKFLKARSNHLTSSAFIQLHWSIMLKTALSPKLLVRKIHHFESLMFHFQLATLTKMLREKS